VRSNFITNPEAQRTPGCRLDQTPASDSVHSSKARQLTRLVTLLAPISIETEKFMSKDRLLPIIVLLITAAPGISSQKVTVDFDTSVDFSGFLTYAWARGRQAKDPLVDRHIIDAVDRRLGDRGLQRVDETGEPDLVAVYYVAQDTGIEVDTSDLAGWGGGWGWRKGPGANATTTARNLAPGEIIIDIAQVKGKRLIWRGVATGTIGDRRDKIEKMLNQALDKMFERFPPPIGR